MVIFASFFDILPLSESPLLSHSLPSRWGSRPDPPPYYIILTFIFLMPNQANDPQKQRYMKISAFAATLDLFVLNLYYVLGETGDRYDFLRRYAAAYPTRVIRYYEVFETTEYVPTETLPYGTPEIDPPANT